MHQNAKEPESPSEFQPYLGRSVGSYILQSIVGVGGMGAVFIATHTRLDKKVAVKLIRASFRNHKEASNRFFSEAKAAAAIGHENIIDVFDVGEDSAAGPYLAMELLENSESLGSVILKEGPLALARVGKITLQAANALYATHTAGLVHCDLKPSNILLIKALGQSDVVKIIDFGIARTAPSQEQDPLISSRLVMGTPKYMSPEQAIGRRPDGRSDQYALALLVYTMLTGKPPFEGTPGEVMKRQYHEMPAPIRAKRQDVTAQVEEVIFRALAKKPEDRFPSIKQFGEHLQEAIQSSLRPRTVPRLPIAAPAPTPPKPDLDSYKAMFESEGGFTGDHAAVDVAKQPDKKANTAPQSLKPNLEQYKAMFDAEGGSTGDHAALHPTPNLSHYKAMFADDSGATGAAPPLAAQAKPDIASYKAMFADNSGVTGAVPPIAPQSAKPNIDQYKGMFEGGATGGIEPIRVEPPARVQSQPTAAKQESTSGAARYNGIFEQASALPPINQSEQRQERQPEKPAPKPEASFDLFDKPVAMSATPADTAENEAPAQAPQQAAPEEPEPRSLAAYIGSGVGAFFLAVGLYWGYLSGYIAPANLPTYPRQLVTKKVVPSFTPQTAPIIPQEDKKDPKFSTKNNNGSKQNPEAPETQAAPENPTPTTPETPTPKTPEVIEVPNFETPEVKSIPGK